MRRAFFWTHLMLGVASGLVVLLMSATGVLLAFEKQVVAFVDRRAVGPTAGPRLGVEALLGRAAAERPDGVPGRVTLRAAPAPVEVSLGRDALLLLDPVTGRPIEGGSVVARAFFHEVTDWHRWLALPPALRDNGRAITGACTLMFLGLLLSGPVIWWPRGGPSAWKTALLFRRGLAGKARDFNWHNVAGVWTVVPLVVVVASALVISYPWASDLVYRAAGETPPPRSRPAGPSARPGGPARMIDAAGLDALVAAAQREIPAWRVLSITPPAADAKSVTVSIDTSGGGRPQTRAQLTLDRASAAVLKSEGYDTQGAGRRARSWLRFLHTGEALGLPGQAVAGVASAAAVLLVYTGLALAFRRWRAWQRARARRDDVVSTVAPGAAGLDFSGGSR